MAASNATSPTNILSTNQTTGSPTQIPNNPFVQPPQVTQPTNPQPSTQSSSSGGFDLAGFLNDPQTQSNKPAAIQFLQQKGIIDSSGNLVQPDDSKNANTAENIGLGVGKTELNQVNSFVNGPIGGAVKSVLGNTAGRFVNLLSGKGFTPMNVQTNNNGFGNYKINGPAQGAGDIATNAAEFVAPGGVISDIAKGTETALKGIDFGSELLNKAIPFIGKSAVKGIGEGTVAGVQSNSGSTGAAVGALGALSPVGSVIAKGLFKSIGGFMSSTGSAVLQRAMDNSDAVSSAVKKYAKTPELAQDLVDTARTAIQKYQSVKSQMYGAAMDKLTVPGQFNGISGALDALKNRVADFGGDINEAGELSFKNSTLTPTDQKNIQTAYETITNWSDKSLKGVDNLRQAIGNLMNDYKIAGNPRSSVVLGDVVDNIKSSLSKNVPGYKQVLQTYGNMSENAKSLIQELSLGANAKPSTQLNRVMGIFQKNPEVLNNLNTVMGKKGADDFLNEVSGSILSEWLPANKLGTAIKGAGEVAGSTAALASGHIAALPAAAAGLASISPRIVGGVAREANTIGAVAPVVRRAATGAAVGMSTNQ